VTPGGTVTEFGGLSDSQPEGITAGPGGDLFFAEFGSASPGRVGKITTGGTLTESAQVATLPPQPQLEGIAEGADSRLWITEPFPFPGLLFLDAMDASFGLTRYAAPLGAQLREITNGPDGNLWIIDAGNNLIDKVSTGGAFLNQYPIPGSGPEGIAAGVDGRLYFGEFTTNGIASITTGGVTVTFGIPTPSSGVNSVTSGPDGNIWFTEGSAGKIGRLIL